MTCVCGPAALASTVVLPRSELKATPIGPMFSGAMPPTTEGAVEALPVSMVPVVACSVPAAGLIEAAPPLPLEAGSAPVVLPIVVATLIADMLVVPNGAAMNTVVLLVLLLMAALVVLVAALVVGPVGAPGTTAKPLPGTTIVPGMAVLPKIKGAGAAG